MAQQLHQISVVGQRIDLREFPDRKITDRGLLAVEKLAQGRGRGIGQGELSEKRKVPRT